MVLTSFSLYFFQFVLVYRKMQRFMKIVFCKKWERSYSPSWTAPYGNMGCFQVGGIKLERFLPKNQHTHRNFLNFENWTNWETQKLAKIRVFKVDYFILPLFFFFLLCSVAEHGCNNHPYMFFLLLVPKYTSLIV